MAQIVTPSRADSDGAWCLSRASLDTSVSGDDTSSVGDSGSALDALWRLEEAHHFLLNNQLAGTFPVFVDDLYAALEVARDALEQQSVRVLAVLHDKDARIVELEQAVGMVSETAEIGVQVSGPRRKHQATQSDNRSNEVENLRLKMSEQEEQIDVLLDELERVQRTVSEEKNEAEETRLVDEIQAACCIETKATQTDSHGGANTLDLEQALVAIAALQQQLDTVEQSHAELQATLEQNQQRRLHESMTMDEPLDLDAIENQLHDAIQRMESGSQCRAFPWIMTDESAMPCLDLEHKLQVADLERDALMDEILTLRAAFANDAISSSSSAALVRVQTRNTVQSSHCTHVMCHHTLRRILQYLHTQRRSHSGRDSKLLQREIRHALRGRKSEEEVAAVVARVVAEWMQWKSSHVDEIKSLRQAQANQRETQAARVANLVNEVYRLSQRNTDLQTEMEVLSRQRASQLLENQEYSDKTSVVWTDTVGADQDRHVLDLEQALLLKQEQLAVANRAIQAMSFDSISPTSNVRFVEPDAAACAIHQTAPALSLMGGKQQIARLSRELQALQERDFRRFQPADTSQHAVVEYFRLEKECLRLKHRLRDKDERIQQLELQCVQLEQTARHDYTYSKSHDTIAAIQEIVARDHGKEDGHARQRIIERYYLRLLVKRNEDLWLELTKASGRIAYLEREVEKTSSEMNRAIDNDDSRLVRELALRVDEYHTKAIKTFHGYLGDRSQYRESSTHDQGTAKRRELVPTAQSIAHQNAYGVLLGHYETLSLQLQLFQTVQPQQHTSQIAGSIGTSRSYHFLERIHVLEDRLLEAQCCLSCGDQVVKKRVVTKTEVGTVTETLATVGAATQVTPRDRQRWSKSKGVQADLEMAPFRCEESQYETANGPNQQASSETVVTTMMKDQIQDGIDARLDHIQRKLEISLARIDKLTAQKEKLKERLEDARRTNRHHVKEQESLRSQVVEVSSLNASLSSQLQPRHETQQPTDPNTQSPSQTQDTHVVADQKNNPLPVMEQENRELVRQLCEVKERCFQADHRAHKLEEALKALNATRAEDHHRHLEEYMTKVSQSLVAIERDKERLTHENKNLHRKLQQVEREAAINEARGTRTCGTETDVELEIDRLLQRPEHQALETRVVMLQNELEMERRACEDLRVAQRDQARTLEAERCAMDDEKATLRKLSDEIQTSHDQLQQEVIEFHSASAEVKDEADKRIHFLTACVEECSRLVDSTSPNDEVVTSRDIYETITTLSKKVSKVSVTSASATLTPRASKRSAATVRPQEKKLSVSAATPSLEANEASRGVLLHTQLQAETWRVRVAKLECSLRAASLKNKTFEDIVDHLEIQMDRLRDEVKTRMTKESSLISKQGQLKVEITSLKAQNGTLTSRLAEACGELKRSQDISKATEGEVARVRSALQRKTELLTRHKLKCDDTQNALDHAVQRIAHLDGAEKNATVVQRKLKDQTLQLHELRQQCTVSRDANAELRAQAEKLEAQLSELQSRGKALRRENGMLRDQLRELKKTMRDDAESAFKSQASDTAVSAAVVVDGKTPMANLTPSATVDMLSTQVKTLKRRVLQKQDVIVAYKTKLAELDAELVLQRTKLFELSQAYRQCQQTQREKEQRMVQEATHLRDDLECSLTSHAEQLDGLRASILDACEVFVQCEPPSKSVPDSPVTSSGSRTWHEDTDDELLVQSIEGDTDNVLLQEVRRYADLSPADLADLRITSPKRTVHKNQQRLDREHAAHKTAQHGARVLQDLEHALEATPQDCRTEICSVLAFLCSHRHHRTPSGLAARRY